MAQVKRSAGACCHGVSLVLLGAMKIYTKILIGMAVGAALGLTLGPKSGFLAHDLYAIERTGGIDLRLDANDPSTKLPLPPSAKIDLKVLSTETVKKTDAKGTEHVLPAQVKVQLTFDKDLALRDKGPLREALGASKGAVSDGKSAASRVKIGETFTVYLIVSHDELDGGEGFLVSPEPISSVGATVIAIADPIGKLFMRLIKMVIVPLVFASLLVGVASLGDVRKLGRLGGKTLALYMCTTAIAVTIGLMVAHVIAPGKFIAEKDQAALVKQFAGAADEKADAAADAPSTVDNILSVIPENPVESMSSGNMLQIIFFAVLLGIALTLLKADRSKQVINFFDTVQHAMIMIIHMVMAIAPYGVAALLTKVVGQSGFSVLKALLVYGATVLLGLLIHAGAVYAGLVRVFAKVKFGAFLKAARPAQLIAFSTSSSSAALPITMECAEENLGVSNAVSSFVIPLGSTVNMDGTALYQGVAAVFIAQVFGIDLSIGDQLSIVGAATMASVGAAGVPGAGMITLAMVLTASGIPTVGVALILGVDRLLDMFRTAVNVTGDLAVTAIMAVSEGETIRTLSADQDVDDPSRGFERRLEKKPHAIAPDSDPEPDPDEEDRR